MGAARRPLCHRPDRRRLGKLTVVGCATAALLLTGLPSQALLPTSPRVKKLIEAGLDSLEKLPRLDNNSKELGGRAVVALALYKGGRKKHPLVTKAVSECVGAAGGAARLDIYSHGLALILLSEIEPRKHRGAIEQYLEALAKKQKSHGGWGYAERPTGDTSQTQYVALGLWQAHRAGVEVESTLARGMIDWLNRTQAPNGAWGYQGAVADGKTRVQQSGVTATMAAAGGASLMIGADLHGLLTDAALSSVGDLTDATGSADLPAGVQRATQTVSPLPNGGVDWPRVSDSIKACEKWMQVPKVASSQTYNCYYLYALERYQSFREARHNEIDLEPKWYEQGVTYLEGSQSQPGVWDRSCGPVVDTALAVLFMLRATQKSLQGGLGEGALVSGRGLPKNLATARLRRGQVIVEVEEVGVADFLKMLDKGESDRLDSLASDPSSLVVGDLSSADAERLESLLRTGEPEQRLVAARALGRAGDLDHVPALLYGMTDPDASVAIESRDALRFIARRPRGFGMPDNYNDDQRYLALEQWKQWYQALRPEAIIDFGR
ncbi:hypothetical protein MalM25_20230 [Planctomycetes bacterium MalM25]|nr:hypothetical protein MalM25_20230 [Planctomycetes bacterium MalM25]